MAVEFSYIEERIDDQKNWHSAKAAWNKRWYYATEIVMLVAGALIPIVNVVSGIPDITLRILSASLAAVAVISGGVGKLFKFQENWLTFRSVAEVLEGEKALFLNAVGDYDLPLTDRQKLLVHRVENILSSTTQRFLSLHKAKEGEEQGEK